eukprot:NODE_358_length_2607_cov_27.603462_g338_i0.p1 GENE.NODE_358_length_2607_cov_27.603462_g338_i0~~NODE_358_length_2607_cov_27.603462_g338_i0.p1  ORF type:complete len:571 (+),score=51.55 NODE_358_length_2607_cov_27.603462_g338_i0:59-1771(+)
METTELQCSAAQRGEVQCSAPTYVDDLGVLLSAAPHTLVLLDPTTHHWQITIGDSLILEIMRSMETGPDAMPVYLFRLPHYVTAEQCDKMHEALRFIHDASPTSYLLKWLTYLRTQMQIIDASQADPGSIPVQVHRGQPGCGYTHSTSPTSPHAAVQVGNRKAKPAGRLSQTMPGSQSRGGHSASRMHTVQPPVVEDLLSPELTALMDEVAVFVANNPFDCIGWDDSIYRREFLDTLFRFVANNVPRDLSIDTTMHDTLHRCGICILRSQGMLAFVFFLQHGIAQYLSKIVRAARRQTTADYLLGQLLPQLLTVSSRMTNTLLRNPPPQVPMLTRRLARLMLLLEVMRADRPNVSAAIFLTETMSAHSVAWLGNVYLKQKLMRPMTDLMSERTIMSRIRAFRSRKIPVLVSTIVDRLDVSHCDFVIMFDQLTNPILASLSPSAFLLHYVENEADQGDWEVYSHTTQVAPTASKSAMTRPTFANKNKDIVRPVGTAVEVEPSSSSVFAGPNPTSCSYTPVEESPHDRESQLLYHGQAHSSPQPRGGELLSTTDNHHIGDQYERMVSLLGSF